LSKIGGQDLFGRKAMPSNGCVPVLYGKYLGVRDHNIICRLGVDHENIEELQYINIICRLGVDLC
jgi:hypothetical protein